MTWSCANDGPRTLALADFRGGLLDEPDLLRSSLIVLLIVVAMGASAFGLQRLFVHADRVDSAFFDAALVASAESLTQFANRVGGVYRPGEIRWMPYTYFSGRFGSGGSRYGRERLSVSGRGASVHCSFRGWQVEVTSSLEELDDGLALVPRVVVRLPPWTSWPRLDWMRARLDNSPAELWRWQLHGKNDRSSSTLGPREQAAFAPLAALACYIRCSTPQELDVRARPGTGQYDEKGRRYRDDFAFAHLSELVERAVAFAQAAVDPP